MIELFIFALNFTTNYYNSVADPLILNYAFRIKKAQHLKV